MTLGMTVMIDNLKILLLLSMLTHYGNIKPENTAFNLALKWVLQYEGPCSNDYGDPGGLTCFGITHAEYRDWRKAKGIKMQSVTKITLEEADEIYYEKYWLATGISKLPFRTAITVFDWEVNSGRGVKTLQRIVGVKQTGHVDTTTVNAVNTFIEQAGNENVLLNAYFDARNAMYHQFANHGQSMFLRGWLNRSNDLKSKLTS
jgi:lysozyme family protein